MGTHDKRNHQPKPWIQNGRDILDASGWTLASARFPDDARRIVAAINAVQGIPTESLESWSVNVIGEPAEAVVPLEEEELSSGSDLPNDRRANERRHGVRHPSRPPFAAARPQPEGERGSDSR